MKRLPLLILGVLALKFCSRLYDFLWEVTNDKYYILWRLAPRWVKRLWMRDEPINSEYEIDENDLMTPEQFIRWMEGDNDGIPRDGS
jgi:hypothetical protein